jgi:hypothetical protein
MKPNTAFLLLVALPLIFSLQIRSKVTTKLTSFQEPPASEPAKPPTQDASVKIFQTSNKKIPRQSRLPPYPWIGNKPFAQHNRLRHFQKHLTGIPIATLFRQKLPIRTERANRDLRLLLPAPPRPANDRLRNSGRPVDHRPTSAPPNKHRPLRKRLHRSNRHRRKMAHLHK